MSNFDKIFHDVSNNNNYDENTRILQYLGKVIKDAGNKIPASDLNSAKNFAISEMRKLITKIDDAKTYREKDIMFAYEDSLLMIFTLACGSKNNAAQDELDTISKLVDIVSKYRVVENAIDDTFKLAKIEITDVQNILEIVKPLKDEYQRSMLYQGLNEYKEKVAKLSPQIKEILADFVCNDFNRILSNDNIDGDSKATLEFAVDVCKYFVNDKLLNMLEKVMKLKINVVRYFALDTLFSNGRNVSGEIIKELAQDLSYAQLTYDTLKKHSKQNLFPKEYANSEYLAKSDLVRWLTYPTELNKEPDEISLIGITKVKKETFYVFKFKSDSDNLSDDLKNVYLIGWSGSDGGTFSNFDKLSDFEKKTPEKTVKYIRKKLLK